MRSDVKTFGTNRLSPLYVTSNSHSRLFTWLRILALLTVLDMVRQGDMESRSEPTVASLCVVVVSMLNSIFRREPDKRTDQYLRESVGRRILVDDDPARLDVNAVSEPVQHAHGLFWLSDIFVQLKGNLRVPHLPYASTIELGMGAWLKAYDVDTLAAFYALFPNTHGSVISVKRNAGRTKNRGTNVTLDVDILQQHLPRPAPVGFNPAAHGVTAIVPRKRTGDQPGFLGGHARNQRRRLGDDDDDDDDDEGMLAMAPGPFLEHLWHQFPVDIVSVAANPKDARKPSYLVLPLELRTSFTKEWMMSSDLRGVFEKVRLRWVDKKTWNAIFDRFFPDKSWKPPAYHMHYKKMKSFVDWRHYSANNLSQRNVELCRKLLKAEFNKLRWVPANESDRVWQTGVPDVGAGGYYSRPRNLGRVPAVVLAINPYFETRLEDVLVGATHPAHAGMIAAMFGGEEFSSDDEGLPRIGDSDRDDDENDDDE
jgi:hypothetical protein